MSSTNNAAKSYGLLLVDMYHSREFAKWNTIESVASFLQRKLVHHQTSHHGGVILDDLGECKCSYPAQIPWGQSEAEEVEGYDLV